jgi:hypothetical protein
VALSRVQLVAEVGGSLANVLTVTGLAATDTAGALKEPINAALRAMGVAETNLGSTAVDLVPDGAEPKALAFARFFVLDRAVDAVQDLTDVTAPGGAGAKDSQTVASLERQRDRALAVAEAYGLSAVGVVAVGYGGVFTTVGPC